MKHKIIFSLIFTFAIVFNSFAIGTTELGVYLFKIPETSIEETMARIKDMGFNAIVVAATDEDVESGKSVSYFPSSVLPMEENTSEDYFQKVIDEAHKRGIKVYAWVNMPNEYFLSLHPDWISILSNGKTSDYYNSDDYFQRIIPPARVVNSEEYRNLLSTLISEISAYNIDGFDLNDNFQWAEYYDESEDKTLTSSFDNFTISMFEQETGASVEGNNPQEYADFIFNNEDIYQKWLEWRVEQVNKLLEFFKDEIAKSSKFIPFRPHLLASKWAKEDYGIDYSKACNIADIPYTMILVDQNENNIEKYRELTGLITGVSSKRLAVSTYLYNVQDKDEIYKRIVLLNKCGANSINLFNYSLIEENSLFDEVKSALKEAEEEISKKYALSRLGVHIVGVESMSESQLDNVFTLSKQSSAKFVRIGLIWSMANPTKGVFDFSQQDLIVNYALKHNLKILLVVAYTPQWASENPSAEDYYLYPPSNHQIGDYQSPYGNGTGYDYLYLFAKTIAERYKGKVEYFELWNEEDSGDSFKSLNGEDRAKNYAKMLFYFYHGIKDGNPEAKVVLGGLADNDKLMNFDKDFLEKILSNSEYPAGNFFDIHNIHTNFKSIEGIKQSIERNRNTLETYEFVKPIWITETSYSPDLNYQIEGFEGGENGYLNYLTKALETELSLTDGVVFWTPLLDNAESDIAYKFNGLFSENYESKTSLAVFKNIANSTLHTWIIPHIAGENWETEVEIYNESGEEKYFTVEKYSNGLKKIVKTCSINPLSSITLSDSDLGKNGFAKIISFSDCFHITLSYRYKDTPSVSAFNINETQSADWIIPIKNIDWFDWIGIALANGEDKNVTLTFNCYKDGSLIKTEGKTLAPKTKLVGTIENLFGLTASDIDYIEVNTNYEISAPILITGNFEQNRHAFLKSIIPKSGAFYINHIAEENWNTEIEIVNPNSEGLTLNLSFPNNSGLNKEVSIPAHSKKSLISGSDLPYSSLAKIESEKPVVVSLYYRFKGKDSICAFPLYPDTVSKNIIFKNKFPDWFDWSGLAFANFLPVKVNVNLIAFKNGEKKGEASFTLNPNEKKVSVVQNLFEDLQPDNFDTIKIKSDYPIPLPIIISGNNEQDRHTFFSGEKLKVKQYPLIANYFLGWDFTEETIDSLAKWDLIVLDMEHGNSRPEILERIKTLNPEIKTLAYMTSEEIETDVQGENSLRGELFSLISNKWWLENCEGNHIVFWEGTWMLNCSSLCPPENGKRWNTTFADFVAGNILSQKLWDGFYADNCWPQISWIDDCIDLDRDGTGEDVNTVDLKWKEGMDTMLDRLNFLCPHSLFMGNGGYSFYPYLNGALIEEFTQWDTWYNEITLFKSIETRMKSPKLNVLNGCGEKNNLSFMRYSLASALFSGGYFSYDAGSQTHSENWWYNEYSINLGVPVEEGQIVFGEPVLSENFEQPQWEINEDLAEIVEGESGKYLKANSLNSSEEWNEYLSSPSGLIDANSEIVIEFKYKVITKQENTLFYVTFRPESQPENYDLTRDIYFGNNTPEGEQSVARYSVKLGNANDYKVIFGIKNKGEITIDDIKVYSDSGKMYSIRRFENGLAIANNSKHSITIQLDGSYKKIGETQALQSININPKDGIILIKVNR